MKLISTPDPDLAIAALAAVRQWTYKPYLLNGEPTELQTTITVNFNFGP
jgi:protein TonB